MIVAVLVGVCFIGIGIFNLAYSIKKEKRIDLRLHKDFLSLVYLFWGGSGIAYYFERSDFWLYCFFPLCTGIVSIWIPFYNRRLIKTCNTEVEAKCVDHDWHPGGIGGWYRPKFEYTYSGVVYKQLVPNSYRSEKKLQKKFPLGETCQIWIDPETPYHCIEKKKMSVWLYLCIPVGVIFILLGPRILAQ